MDLKDFKAGYVIKQTGYGSFQPEKINHTFTWSDPKLNVLLEEATLKLGELNTYSHLVPAIDLFIKMHIYKEATVSSKIEGTKTDIEEALMNENDLEPEKRNDWNEVNNYVMAMNYAINELKTLPLSSRLLKKSHEVLMSEVRGENKSPGHFRTSQNWIGGVTLNDAIFIPPSANSVDDLMGDLELFLHNKEIDVPHLIKIAIAHYQFETIHPFLDGNGRLGRLLITLYFVSTGVLKKPILYLSDFFDKNKGLYYDNLTVIRQKNDLTQWIKFFLVAVIETCKKGLSTLDTIMHLKEVCEGEKILTLGKKIPNAKKLMNLLYSEPVLPASLVKKTLAISDMSTYKLIDDFIRLGILKELTGFKRNRIFVFNEYINLFD